MTFFDEQYKKALEKINKRLETEQDQNEIQKLLLDKKSINRYLSKEPIDKKPDNALLDQDKITDFVFNNKFSYSNLNAENIFLLNRKSLNDLTQKFVEKFSLLKTYNDIVKKDELKIKKGKNYYLGATIYINSLNENYIEICPTGKLIDYSTFIHELSHAKQNVLSREGKKKLKFCDTYPTFMELIFADWLKENNLLKESYNIKISILNQAKKLANELYDEIDSYFQNKKKRCSEADYFFKYKYNLLKQIVLAICLYNLYLSNPEQTLKRVELFVLNLKKLEEEELLQILGMNNNIFDNNQIVYKVCGKVKEEKKKILKK